MTHVLPAAPLYVKGSPPAINLSCSVALCAKGHLAAIPPRMEHKLWPLLHCQTYPMHLWCSHLHLHAHHTPALHGILVNPPLPG